MMGKRRDMKIQSAGDKIEAVQLTNIINNKQQEDVRKANLMITNAALIQAIA